ncbi:MAG TPA: zinc-binding dehydrogenase [Vicinamibacterales bacterium]|nr:zinc-binding dehydrogenase [Vicinamibacterales bacterium]
MCGGRWVPRAQTCHHDVRGSRHRVRGRGVLAALPAQGQCAAWRTGARPRKAGFPRSLRALKRGGRYVLVGVSGGLGGIARALLAGGLAHLRGRARFITGAADPKQADLVFLQELIDAGKLRTVIGRRYTLDEIVEAHRYADTGHKAGNVAVLIGDQAEHAQAGRRMPHPL